MILGLIDEAVEGGARQSEACRVLGLDRRTVQRWSAERQLLVPVDDNYIYPS